MKLTTLLKAEVDKTILITCFSEKSYEIVSLGDERLMLFVIITGVRIRCNFTYAI